jgi:photosystem II stability/assembly factor-like uncharacterized protein
MNKQKYLNLIIMSMLLILSYPSFSQNSEEKIKVPDSLNRVAIISHKANTAILLSVTHAGNKLVAAGERGIILTSDDNGLNWKQAIVPTSANLTSLKFLDANNGWATGHMGIILNTKDGGKTWTKQLDGIQAANIAVQSVAGSDNTHAIKEASYLVSDGPDKPFFDIDMQANGYGIAIGAFNLAFVTLDSGKTWRYLSPNINNKLNKHLYQVNKVKQGYVILGEQGLILYSSDNGQSFDQLTSPYAGTWFGMLVASNDSWIAYGLKGNVYVSHNQGADWSKIQSNTAASISAATELSNGTVILATQAGELLAGKINSDHFDVIKHLPGFPVTSIDEAESGDLIITGLRGVIKVNKNDIKSQLAN